MKRYMPGVIFAAKDLRSQGYTYREICNRLDRKIPKATLSSWLSGIQPPAEYYQRMKMLGHENIRLAQIHNRLELDLRLNKIKQRNINIIKEINNSIGKVILAVLYWCEGNKYPASRNLRFGNSDPKMIKLFLTLLRRCYPIEERKFRLTVQCRSDQNTTILTDFWRKVTQIPTDKHYHPRTDKRSNGKTTQKTNYKGVCVIDYFDVDLQCELQFFGELLGSDKSIEQVKSQIK